MEDEIMKKDLLSMIELLSTFIIKNKIEMTEMRIEFFSNIAQYVKAYSLKGLKVVIDLFHMMLGHQGSSIRLECGGLHCIECYDYFLNQEFYDEITVCTCGKRINPKYRSIIQNEYIRLQNLKRQCCYCNISKDIMNFNQIEHNCQLCIDCLKLNFNFFSNDNYCPYCYLVFSEESLNAIRSILADQQDATKLLKFYTKECFLCQKNKDSRLFTQICKQKHFCCEDCINELKNTGRNRCNCDTEISIFS